MASNISFIVLGILLLHEVESICYTCGYTTPDKNCVDTFIPRDGRESTACTLSRDSKYKLCRKYRDGWTIMCKRSGSVLMCKEPCYTGQASSTNHSLCLILVVAFVHIFSAAWRHFC